MPDAQPKPTAAERAVAIVDAHQRTSQGLCSADHPRDQFIDSGVPMWTPQHVVRMLAAAGLLATAEPVVVEVHHHGIEKHAASFNEGYEAAVAQGLADDPTLAADWLAEHDAQVLRDAAEAWLGETPPGGGVDDWGRGWLACRDAMVYDLGTARPDRIAAGGQP